MGFGSAAVVAGLVVGQALLEALDALGDVTHQVGNLAAAEQQHDDQNDQRPVPDRHRTHETNSFSAERGNSLLNISRH